MLPISIFLSNGSSCISHWACSIESEAPSLHRDLKVWEEVTKFKPERFEGMEVKEIDGFKFAPFGVGRRACLGAALGKIMSLALGGLIQCFEWERVDAEKVDMSPGSGVTMPKIKPLQIIFHPRPTMTNLISQL